MLHSSLGHQLTVVGCRWTTICIVALALVACGSPDREFTNNEGGTDIGQTVDTSVDLKDVKSDGGGDDKCTTDDDCKDADGKSACNEPKCDAGVCSWTPKSCDDGIPCTIDSCGDDGCEHKADDSKCTDGDVCVKYACDLEKGCAAAGANVGATCDDGDECTTGDVCDDQGKCAGPDNTCKCKEDADCDNTDLCLPRKCNATSGECEVDAANKVVCDDKDDNVCATNTCDPKTGKCALKPQNDDKACDDDNVCTSNSACKEGVCLGDADKKCDDNNPCTTDVCDPAKGCKSEPTTGSCDDSNPCTDSDTCDQGVCKGAPKPCDDGVACTTDSCDPGTGKCENKPNEATCDDNNPCTTDVCDASKGCQNTADDSAKCEDDDKCTVTACSAGKCVVKSLDKTIPGCGSSADSECDDNNACTKDTCNKGDCKIDPAPLNGSACTGASLCVVGDKCDAGKCGGGKPKVCDDKNPCTNDSCDVKTGKCNSKNKANGAACDADGDLCTVKDSCDAGKCVAGAKNTCAGKGDACNLAVCDAKTGNCNTKPAAKGTTCDDGKYCTDKDVCDGAGKCTAGKARDCSKSGDACNTGICDETAGACAKKPKASGAACSDDQYCTVADTCDGKGSCKSGKARVCASDAKACKLGLCDEKNDKCGYKNALSGAACNDGNACTKTDKCDSAGVCKGGDPTQCAGDACNEGVCDAKTGDCSKAAKKDGAPCDDQNPCSVGDTCSSGKCKAGKPKSCDDKNMCTADSCIKGQCVNKPLTGNECLDGNQCTLNDKCSSLGKCVGTPIVCNDGNACTSDKCVSGKCAFTNNDANKCTDNDSCSVEDSCKAGKCVSKPKNCDDKNMCTADSCSKGLCVNKPLPGNECLDGDPCTKGDTCSSLGKCAGKAIVCNDNNPCTNDKCVSGKCEFANANTNKCTDNNACTLGDYCSAGKCVAGKPKVCTDSTICTSNTCDTKTGACLTSAANNGKKCEAGSYSSCDNKSCKCNAWGPVLGSTTYKTKLMGVAPTADGGFISVGYDNYVSGGKVRGVIVRHDKWGKQTLYTRPLNIDCQLYSVVRLDNTKEYVAVGWRYISAPIPRCLGLFTSTKVVKSLNKTILSPRARRPRCDTSLAPSMSRSPAIANTAPPVMTVVLFGDSPSPRLSTLNSWVPLLVGPPVRTVQTLSTWEKAALRRCTASGIGPMVPTV